MSFIRTLMMRRLGKVLIVPPRKFAVTTDVLSGSKVKNIECALIIEDMLFLFLWFLGNGTNHPMVCLNMWNMTKQIQGLDLHIFQVVYM